MKILLFLIGLPILLVLIKSGSVTLTFLFLALFLNGYYLIKGDK